MTAIADGTSFAFVELNVSGKGVNKLCEELAGYQQLRYLTLDDNLIEDLRILARLPYLLKISAKGNKVGSLEVFDLEDSFRFTREVDLSKNLIVSLTPLRLPELTHLTLSLNQIASAHEFRGHKTLQKLELRGNKLVNLQGLANMPHLTELYLAQNEITSLSHLENLPSLSILHLRSNKLDQFSSLPSLPSLHYLNLRENPVSSIAEIAKLKEFPELKKLNLQGTQVAEELGDNLKKEVLIVLSELKIVNKDEVSPEEREDAISEASDRAKQAEEARKEAERQAKEAEEQKAKEEAEQREKEAAEQRGKEPIEDDSKELS